MKEGIHPEYTQATVTCGCGNTFTVGSTKAVIHTEVCSACHPFYTGQKKLVDAAGRVERFTRLLEKTEAKRRARVVPAKAGTKSSRPRKETPASRATKLG